MVLHAQEESSPYFGGMWEAGVKSLKHHLGRALGKSSIFFYDVINSHWINTQFATFILFEFQSKRSNRAYFCALPHGTKHDVLGRICNFCCSWESYEKFPISRGFMNSCGNDGAANILVNFILDTNRSKTKSMWNQINWFKSRMTIFLPHYGELNALLISNLETIAFLVLTEL